MSMTARLGVGAIVLSLITICGCAKPVGKNASIRELVENEHAFAATAAERGLRSAFLSFLAEDGVIFRPDAVNGHEWYLSQKETGAYLGWEPVYADISRSGDLGFTTGPWEYSEKGEAEAADIFGQYLSVWKKNTAGNWRVVIDMGTVHPKSDTATARLTTSNDRSEKSWVGESSDDVFQERRKLERTEFEFSKLRGEIGGGPAYGRYADENIRFLRMDNLPLIGVDAVRRFFVDADVAGGRDESSEIGGSDVSTSGDLGYTYGTNGMVGGESFVRIWKRKKDGSWTIALDISIPRPDESDAE